MNKGLAHIFIIVLVLTILGVLTVIAISSRQTVTINSRERAETVLAKNCPSQEELAATERYIQEAGLDDLLEEIEAKKAEPPCTILQRVRNINISVQDISVSECVSPYLIPVDPLLQSCRICYDKINTKTQRVVKERKCENYVIQSVDECFNWDITSYKPEINCYNSIWKNAEPPEEYRRRGGEVPVGFPDQYDFSDYQTETREPPLEPLSP